jgi:ERCC4-related helicase
VDWVVHPRIRPGSLEDRAYQRAIAEHALRENVLAVLPTGTGKTAIALRLMAEMLSRHPGRSQLFLAPTRPLVVQHARTVGSLLEGPPAQVYTGAVPPERRRSLFHPPALLFATPQVVANDLEAGELRPEEFSLVVFDEAHRAQGDYPYVALGRAFSRVPGTRILGMTASPGSSKERILQVMGNLGVAPRGLEYREVDDPDVAPYLHPVSVQPVVVENPPALKEVARRLRAALDRQVARLRQRGFFRDVEMVGRGDLLRLGEELRAQRARERSGTARVPGTYWEVVTAQAVAMKAFHALDLTETQGAEALRRFLERLRTRGGGRLSPADREFLRDPDVVEAIQGLERAGVEHPKIARVVQVVRDELAAHPGSKALVFAHYRDTAQVLVEELSRGPAGPVRAARFVGQASRGEADQGLSQKSQVEILDRFRSGEVNCLVATSVAEEGLDIPDTDLVVFYEPVPSEIRTIQRRGRTGRFHAGRVVVLVSQGTRDQVSQYASGRKERRIRALLEEIRAEGGGEVPRPERGRQSTLEQFGSPARPR